MQNQLLKRIISMFIVIAMALVCFAGCGDSENSSGNGIDEVDESAPVTIKVGIWSQASDQAGTANWENYQAIMKERYPNITLQAEPYSYSSDTFIPMAVSGTAPNIFSCPFTEPTSLISSEFVADITDYAKKYGLYDALTESMTAPATVDGKLYGLPRDGYAMSLMINMSLFRAAGLVDSDGLPIYPKTFDELAQTAQTITEETGKAGFIMTTLDRQGGWQFSNIAWNFGAELQYQDESGKWVNGIASDASVQALEYIKRLRWELGVMPDNALVNLSTAYQLFATGEGAMMLCGSDSFNIPVQNYKMNKEDIAVVPVPEGPGGQYSLLGGVMYMFSADSTANQIDACFKLLDVIGYSADPTDEVLQAIEDEIKVREENGYAIGPRSLNVWSSQERLDAEQEIYDRYTNVDMRLYQTFYDTVYDTLKMEEKYYCQDMYSALDTAVQEVMTNSSADCKSLLEQASSDFQIFLDQMN